MGVTDGVDAAKSGDVGPSDVDTVAEDNLSDDWRKKIIHDEEGRKSYIDGFRLGWQIGSGTLATQPESDSPSN